MKLHPATQAPAFLGPLRDAQFAAMDNLRHVQANTLDLFGFGAHESAFEVVASGPHWRLRHYAGAAPGAPLLLVPAPIKRPYIWDLAPSVSTVRFCLDQSLDVYLLEWIPPSDGAAGIEEYAEGAIAVCAKIVAERSGGALPCLVGHSLGGTLAAICCALHPSLARGLVLLGAPLSFEPGSSRFRDLVVSLAQTDMVDDGVVAGSLLSQGCVFLSPATFLWPRWMDAAFSLTDPAAMDIHIRVDRWALDEMPLPGRLIHQIVGWLYREDRFHRGVLTVGGREVGPADLRLPVLAVVSAADEIGPRASVEPFFGKTDSGKTRIIEYPTEIGVGLQHLAILAGRRAHAETWPEIAAWLKALD